MDNEKNKFFRAKIIGVPEEFVYLFRFCQTAESFSKEKKDIAKRYTTSPEVLKKDLYDGPIIEKRLESLTQKSQDSPLTNQFANEYLPYVKEFNKMLQEYVDSLQNNQEQP